MSERIIYIKNHEMISLILKGEAIHFVVHKAKNFHFLKHVNHKI